MILGRGSLMKLLHPQTDLVMQLNLAWSLLCNTNWALVLILLPSIKCMSLLFFILQAAVQGII